MEIIACPNGHFYDKSKGSCPECASEKRKRGENAVNGNEIGATMPSTEGFNDSNGMNIPETTPVFQTSSRGNSPTIGETIPVSSNDFNTEDFNPNNRGVGIANQMDDFPETRPAGFETMSNFDPIVGWLICVDGPNKGQDYRLHAGNNRIGRSPKNDVYLQGDLTVSVEDNCIVGFDTRSGRFYFAAGMGKNMVYLNNDVVYSHIELHAYDVITVGNTNLMFIPLCGEHFSWNK